MGSFSIWHWLVVGAIVLLMFGGRGKISDIMGDFAKGIKAFKRGLNDEDATEVVKEPVKPVEHAPPASVTTQAELQRKVG